MGNIWDLPEASHPVHGRKRRKHVEHHEHEHEEHEEGFERVGKTITDAAVTAMGIGVIGALGANVISSLKK